MRGLDAACTALVDGHHVRLRNGMHIKELVEKLRSACDRFDKDNQNVNVCFAIMIRLRWRDIEIPAGTMSARLQSLGGDSIEVADRILRLLKSPDAAIEVSLNSNPFLVADTLEEWSSTLADFIKWLQQHKLNFFLIQHCMKGTG